MKVISKYLSAAVCVGLLAAGPRIGFAEEQETLLGVISPQSKSLRESLEKKGVTLKVVATQESETIAAGGLKRGTRYNSNYDMMLTIDTAKAGLWDNGTFFFYGLGDYSTSPSSLSGEFNLASNIEATDAWKLFEAWYEHTLFDGSLSVKAGLHNYNSEFNVVNYGTLFLNSPFGVPATISQVGPSIFPTTSLAGRVKYQFTPEYYGMVAAYDGVPGDPNNSNGTHIKLHKDDGIFYAYEVGNSSTEEDSASNYHKVGLGGFYSTTKFEDYSGEGRLNNYGLYAFGEKSIYHESDSEEQGLGAFTRVGWAAPDRNQFDAYAEAGLNYVGLIPGRDDDISGIAVNFSHNAADFRDANPDYKSGEWILELTHRTQLLPWFALQPDIQYIFNPSGDPSADDALLFLLRAQIIL